VDIHAFYPQATHKTPRVPSPRYPQGYHRINALILFRFIRLSTEKRRTIYSYCIYLLIKLISYCLLTGITCLAEQASKPEKSQRENTRCQP